MNELIECIRSMDGPFVMMVVCIFPLIAMGFGAWLYDLVIGK